jgi:hypothetical protein
LSQVWEHPRMITLQKDLGRRRTVSETFDDYMSMLSIRTPHTMYILF